ncbi:ABC transporter permease [Bacillus cereus group sp. BfR-BA-01331]|uniref:ABC transporter permease n=1 Tax=Bacillus cereus group sp. BfR-BA-01331 TaxID=2920307 RepID=UPI001F57FACC|nr:ABC transporter permease [Bacillus cereus group sp. BfR-BA-01331]
MFRSLFIYELEKFWFKKINVLCFLCIPIIVLLSLKFSLTTNNSVKPIDVAFSSNLNFHITSLQEMLFTAFNAIVITFCALSFHEEYRKGYLRMALTRGISIKKLYLVKSLVLALNVFLILLLQFLISYFIGLIALPKLHESALFFKDGLYDMKDIIIFSFKYYLLAYMSLITFGSIIEFISLKCKSITGVIGLSLGFLFTNILLYVVIGYFVQEYPDNHPTALKYESLSLLFTQVKGAAYFAAGVSNVFIYTLIVTLVIFKILSYISFTNTDYLD